MVGRLRSSYSSSIERDGGDTFVPEAWKTREARDLTQHGFYTRIGEHTYGVTLTASRLRTYEERAKTQTCCYSNRCLFVDLSSLDIEGAPAAACLFVQVSDGQQPCGSIGSVLRTSCGSWFSLHVLALDRGVELATGSQPVFSPTDCGQNLPTATEHALV